MITHRDSYRNYCFITVKEDLSRINGANLSVCVSDSFMEAVKADGDWELGFPDLDDPEYDEKWDGILSHWKKLGKKVVGYKTVKARYLWDLICTAAWRSAEPGLVFMERYNKWYNNWYWNTINCVNPCGEEGLPAWGVCNLASLNLAAFVKGYEIDKPGEFDYVSLAQHARIAVRFQDDVVDADKYIYEEEVKEVSGVEIGAVPPFGNIFNINLFVDKKLSENETIYFNAGEHTKSINMRYEDFVKVTKPVLGEFSI